MVVLFLFSSAILQFCIKFCCLCLLRQYSEMTTVTQRCVSFVECNKTHTIHSICQYAHTLIKYTHTTQRHTTKHKSFKRHKFIIIWNLPNIKCYSVLSRVGVFGRVFVFVPTHPSTRVQYLCMHVFPWMYVLLINVCIIHTHTNTKTHTTTCVLIHIQ